MKLDPRKHLRAVTPSRDEVTNFLTKAGPDGLSPNRGWTYDAELGFVHCDCVHEGDGVDGTRTFYHYEADGARSVLNARDKSCRIHAYGNSFTHCDQVNDGETWSEFLAARLNEPVRNYGVGGYGVYQAFRRMQKIDREGEHRADYVILNIWDDDHFRNLDAWRGMRFGRRTNTGFTIPHLRVDPGLTKCEPVENPIQTAEDVYKLCDAEWVYENYKDDPILKLLVASSEGSDDRPIPIAFGLPVEPAAFQAHKEAALFASRQVITWAKEFCERTNRRLMVVLSFGDHNIAAALRGDEPFDRTFTDWLKQTGLPVVDMRKEFAEAYKSSSEGIDAFLKPYYIGHHSPLGNFFFARAMVRHVVEWLDPKPAPYR